MANEQNKVEADLEKALGEIAKAGVMQDARVASAQDARTARPQNWTPQQPSAMPMASAHEPMSALGLLGAAVDQSYLTVESAMALVAAVTGEEIPKLPAPAKRPQGMMPSIAYSADEIGKSLARIRTLIDRVRRMA